MPDKHNAATFAEILDTIRQLSADRQTGTLFITTEDNHAARFVLENGRITAIGYSQLRGYDALPKLQQIKSGSYRFVDGGYISMEEVPMPETPELLGMLLEGDHLDETTAQTPIPSGRRDVCKLIQKELTAFLGPIAGLICEDYFEDHGYPAVLADIQHMIEELAEEIDDPTNQRQFKARVADVINKL